MAATGPDTDAYWSRPAAEAMALLETGAGGLGQAVAAERLRTFGPNVLVAPRRSGMASLLLDQVRSPLVLILVFAALISLLVRDWVDACIVLVILFGSAMLRITQTRKASRVMERLRERTAIRCTAWRDGSPAQVPAQEVVSGDVIELRAGSLIPADALVLEARDLFVSQALLTGESLPVEKTPGVVGVDVPLAERTNCLFMGTSVRSGTGRALVINTANRTELGRIARHLSLRPPETEFERGLRRFGLLLSQIIFLLTVVIFVVNAVFGRPLVEALLFAAAIAVGMSPELLPAVVTTTLAVGAQRMASAGVLVRRLESIENLGSIDVLCVDKTGTLTEGEMRLEETVGWDGLPLESIIDQACANAALQTGMPSPLDEAILAGALARGGRTEGWRKIDETPYDFVRKRVTVVIESPEGPLLITKGACEGVLSACGRVRAQGDAVPLTPEHRARIEATYADRSSKGFRVLGLASALVAPKERFTPVDERDLVFEGLLVFADPLKPDIRHTLEQLRHLGVSIKIVTGDSAALSAHVAQLLGFSGRKVMTGRDLSHATEEALVARVETVSVFAEIDPNQKELIIRALRRAGHVVGYLGDGINDAPALHAADVGISVDRAADVAREAADFVLLKHDLSMLREGIVDGRQTFANTLKYVNITTSASFGNMLSMAIASLVLPFLPLLAKQVLLNNFLSDLPMLAVAADRLDPREVASPRRWSIAGVRRVMLVFGGISVIFDGITFATLWLLVGLIPELFRTGWFVESLLTELMIVFVLRTRRSFLRSKPGRGLLHLTLGVAATALVIPYLPMQRIIGFAPLSPVALGAIVLITAAYLGASELAKRCIARDRGGARGQRG